MNMTRDELSRLTAGNKEPHSGALDCIAFEVGCSQGASYLLRRCEAVLTSYDDVILRRGTADVLPADLPGWFVAACAPDRTASEAAAYLRWWDSLSPAEKDAVAAHPQTWTLKSWLHAMDEERREWWWWRGIGIDDLNARVECEVLGLPLADGALRWLFRAAGAEQVVDVLTE